MFSFLVGVYELTCHALAGEVSIDPVINTKSCPFIPSGAKYPQIRFNGPELLVLDLVTTLTRKESNVALESR